MSNLPAVTDETFAAEVLQSSTPVLVEFWAPWCGPCRQVAPVVEALAAEWGDRAKVVTMNSDDNFVTASSYRVLSLPALKVFRDGTEVASIIGAKPRRVLAEQLTSFIDEPRS